MRIEIESIQVRVKDSPILNVGIKAHKPFLIIIPQIDIIQKVKDGLVLGTGTLDQCAFPRRCIHHPSAVADFDIFRYMLFQFVGKEEIGATFLHFPYHPLFLEG